MFARRNRNPRRKNLFRDEKDPEAPSPFFQTRRGKCARSRRRTSYAERINPIWPYLRLLLLALCGSFLASSLLTHLLDSSLAPASPQRSKTSRVRVVSILRHARAHLSFFCAENPSTLSAPSASGPSFFLGTIAFAVLSLIGLYLAVSIPRDEIHPAIGSTPSSSPSPPAS